MGRFDEQIGARRDEVGATIADLQAQLDARDTETAIITATTVDVPVIDNTFAPIYSQGKKKGKIAVTLRYANFGTAIDIKVALVPRASILTSDDYNNLRFSSKLVDAPFGEDVIATQLVTSPMEAQFEPLTQYDVIRLAALGSGDGDVAVNPTPDPTFAGYPANILYTFTTPAVVGLSPNRPHLGNIIRNGLDDTTPHQLDVFLFVQVIAPASASANATGTVAISATVNPTTVTGTGTAFLADFPVGAGIEVNGETHIVTATPSNVSLTVDYPWKQTLSGQTATKKTLHTWAEADIRAVIPKFQLSDDPGVANAPHRIISAEEASLTSIEIEVPGFKAGESYDYTRNVTLTPEGVRGEATPLVTQTFTAGNFSSSISAVTGEFIYATVDPDNPNQRETSFALTQPSPPYLLERYEFYKKRDGVGTVTTNGTTSIVGSGTAFLGDFASGHFIEIGSDVLEVDVVTDDTHLTTIESAATSSAGQSYVVSVKNGEGDLQRGKFHPSAGGRLKPLPLGPIKTKKLTAYDFVFELFGANGQTKSFTDSFTTTAAPQLLVSPGPIIRNGGCNISTATVTELAQWASWNGSSFPIASNSNAITTSSSEIRWANTTSSIRVLASTTYRLIISTKKRLQPGFDYATTFYIRSTTAGGWQVGIKIHFFNVSRSSSVDNVDSVFTTTIAFNDTDFHLVQIVPRFKQTPDVETSVGAGDNANHVMAFEFVNVTNDVYLRDFMPVRGPNLLAYASLSDELDGTNAGNTPQTYVAPPDLIGLGGEYGSPFGRGDGGQLF